MHRDRAPLRYSIFDIGYSVFNSLFADMEVSVFQGRCIRIERHFGVQYSLFLVRCSIPYSPISKSLPIQDRCIRIERPFDVRYSLFLVRCSIACSPISKCLSSETDAMGSSATSVFVIQCSLFGVQFLVRCSFRF